MSKRLLEALQAREGIVCAVGAGGKKTTLYALLAAQAGRVGLTTTVMMTKFSRRLDAQQLIVDAPNLAEVIAQTAREHPRLAFARPSRKSGRVAGIDANAVAPCHAAGGFDVTLVKADGARMRSIKAPAEDEPIIPPEASVVVPIVSAAAFGAPLDDAIAHRPERVAAVTGLAHGEAITPEAVGQLLAADDGALQGVPAGATVIPVINAVDDSARRIQAETAAAFALEHSARTTRVVLTSHQHGEPVVATLEGTPER